MKIRIISLEILLICFGSFAPANTLNDEYQYVSPRPGAKYVALETILILRFETVSPADLLDTETLFKVEGVKAGPISGHFHVASDGATIQFKPDKPLLADDTVTVRIFPTLPVTLRKSVKPMSFQFYTISESSMSTDIPDEQNTRELKQTSYKPIGTATIMPNGVSVPSDFPHIRVGVNNNPADGYIFLNNWRNDNPYNIIFDNDGSPVWYMRTASGDRRRDFKVQKNGTISMLTRQGGQRFLGYDMNFNLINEYRPAEPYGTDEHELQVLENGHYLIIGVRSITLDWSNVVPGGQRNVNVRETTMQEFTAEHELIFNWPALEHFDPNDVFGYCTPNEADPTSNSIRFTHMNAIDIDYDGHFLLSSRHLSEVTKIHRQTGEIIWRLGGANNQFSFVNDEPGGFNMQHDIRSLGDNHYTVFDNGNVHNPQRSRGVEYELDLEKKTATLVWEYRNPPGTRYSHYMGNAQRLPNGNTLINWAEGDRPKATEVTQAGQVAYEMNFEDQYDCYRTFRFPWTGVVAVPTLFVEPSQESIKLIYNKFGDESVQYYNIYGEPRANPTTLLDTSKATMKDLIDLQNQRTYYFRVTAVDYNGAESGYSNEVSAYVNLTDRTQNMVRNSDFSNGRVHWNLDLNGSARASWNTADQVANIRITNPGSESWHIQFTQEGMTLVTGEQYLFEFDGWADAPRSIAAIIMQAEAPFKNYGEIGLTALSRAKQHFSYTFVMRDAPDFSAMVLFALGQSDADVYLDNISFKQVKNTTVKNNRTPMSYHLSQNYPNPFNPTTQIQYTIPEQSHVTIKVYNLMGREIKKLMRRSETRGSHTIRFNASELSTGVYIYELTAQPIAGGALFRDYKKMMVLH